ncbi:c-type cytochrome [Mesonia mobilis]|uniref:Cytochrome c domain-containing protein n=1 Tax=Mesonia mobilis TaxID=369791 RepID=A0ABQ3BLV2_9FLAO|nr:cytochrome c [Mesonia mobilis]GGZ51143.1 hypothetical protein GCM10008088_11210 [Mesonia mobilis]
MKKLLYISLTTILLVACKNEKTSNNDTAPEASKVETKKTPLQESMARGKSVYSKNCAQCHLATGNGIPNSYPPLRKSDWFTKKREESIHAVKYGLSGEIIVNGKTYDNVMTPMGLSDQEVADVLNYAMNMWGNKQEKMVSSEEVSQVEK